MSRIIALFNQSGGVGKSTLTMNLGYHLAQRHPNRVLLIDMDPQASLTTFMGLEPENLTKTVYEAAVGEEPLTIHPEPIHGMSLVPSNINLSAAELELVSALMREMRLKNAIAPILDKYDFILIDCPPSLGILSVISLVAATHVLVPIQCQFKSFQGTDLLLNTVARLRKAANRSLAIAGFIPTMYDARTAQESRTFKAISEQLSPLATVYEPISKAIAFADASEARLPLALFNRKHPAVDVLEKISLGLEKLK
ncbi:ParA family protein [Anabaena cylindrica FACHB-243]|uniref:Cobyrinic acid ac-diamide synthase n=1 Tax=Anabaena cylindrica (strain ATCC 27899 / PCC 7122) TaxID=272123 RepID=K9ZRJ8_ANACC|nr:MULTISPECIES: ParA family protein [Anabaena]AFZ61162.1 Cobyrinic acid ac-diamide synthase [Anabaena cylindrica PCC 7122]MBD2421638.1 ParA family protein [Anabaena cylindrica FACHB-243]MBY5280463.1 ParA family protein [Anabaena sp. CCAP 1446/1C]MBY5308194.1 ParA family protein [Anabaena sp. CCAP 1446/1C]MCM2405460.1 ParA family protein [Anabaena sp. CCAP 1446/1C]